MPPTVLIHIGPMKTASTYLQIALKSGRARLDKAGVHYAVELLDDRNPLAHRKLVQAARRPDVFEVVRPRVQALCRAGHHKIVITSEFFLLLTPPEITRLRQLFGDVPVKIVSVVRRWSDRVPSLHYQDVYYGYWRTLPEFYAGLVNRKANPDFNYVRLWERWAQVFGRENVILLPLSNILDAKEAAFDRFCTDVLGIAELRPLPRQGKKAWASLAPEQTELLRAVNLLQHRDHAPRLSCRDALQNLEAALELPRIYAAMEPHTQPLLLDDAAGHFTPVMRQMAAWRDRLPDPSQPIFVPRQRTVQFIGGGYLEAPGMTERLEVIRREFVTFTRAKARAGRPAWAGSGMGEARGAASV